MSWSTSGSGLSQRKTQNPKILQAWLFEGIDGWHHAIMERLSTLFVLLLGVGILSSTVNAQTVGSLGDRRRCTTEGGEAIAAQLAAYQRDCLTPGKFVRFHPHDNIILNSNRVHPYLQTSARDAIWEVADAGTVLRVSSAFRPISDQYLLWRSLGGPNACIDAARPGGSRHQSGRAVDLSNAGQVVTAMQSRNCIRLVGDPPHYDCPGENLGADSVRAFQALWNRNNPNDPIDEDGAWGPQTEARLRQTPASGFQSADCQPTQCEPACENGELVNADCSRTSCGVLGECSTATGTPVCASVFCIDNGQPTPGNVCAPNGSALVTCNADGTAGETIQCDCVDEGGARCDGEVLDAGTTMDASVMDASPLPRDSDVPWIDGRVLDASEDGSDGGDGTIEAGCGCRVTPKSTSPWFGFMLFCAMVAVRRTQRRH